MQGRLKTVSKIRKATFAELGIYCALPCTERLAYFLSSDSHYLLVRHRGVVENDVSGATCPSLWPGSARW